MAGGADRSSNSLKSESGSAISLSVACQLTIQEPSGPHDRAASRFSGRVPVMSWHCCSRSPDQLADTVDPDKSPSANADAFDLPVTEVIVNRRSTDPDGLCRIPD